MTHLQCTILVCSWCFLYLSFICTILHLYGQYYIMREYWGSATLSSKSLLYIMMCIWPTWVGGWQCIWGYYLDHWLLFRGYISSSWLLAVCFHNLAPDTSWFTPNLWSLYSLPPFPCPHMNLTMLHADVRLVYILFYSHYYMHTWWESVQFDRTDNRPSFQFDYRLRINFYLLN